MEFSDILKKDIELYNLKLIEIINDQTDFLNHFYKALDDLISDLHNNGLAEYISEISYTGETEEFQRQASFDIYGFNIRIYAPKIIAIDEINVYRGFMGKVFITEDSPSVIEQIFLVGNGNWLGRGKLGNFSESLRGDNGMIPHVVRDTVQYIFQSRVFKWSEFNHDYLNHPEKLRKIGFASDVE